MTPSLPNTKEANIATAVSEDGEYFVDFYEVAGERHRWKLRPSLLTKLALELVTLAFKSRL